MSRVEARLEELGLVLPAPMNPPGNFKLVNVHGGIAYIAGHPAIDGSTILVEGVVGHHILTVHHVRDDVADPLPWDLAFLAFGALLLVGGWARSRRDRAGVDVRAVGDEAVDPGRGGRPAGERVSRLPR